MIGAIGVVYGDIGTSPLYAFKQAFEGNHAMPADAPHIFGVLSLMFWTMTMIVSLKYALLVLRADNKGEGGSLALLALVIQVIRDNPRKWLMRVAVWLGIAAAALFYGDSMITPAITVLGAVEGLDVAVPGMSHFVLPVTAAVIIALFMIQRRGTATVGRLFGPVMLVWFATLAALGVLNIIETPEILAALNPYYGFKFLVEYPGIAPVALAAVFLVVTGSEAMYADMGHFGPRAIRLSWFWMVMPALVINYFGQGALVLRNPAAAANPFFLMAPEWSALPMVILATIASAIASQAVISGTFSLSRQAMQMGFLPRMKTIHTSETERGQIYVPFVNWMLMLSVLALVFGFKSSTNLAAAYGVAVSGDMAITTIQLALVMFLLWRWKGWVAALIAVPLFIIDVVFFIANATKIPHGGWVPLVIAAAGFVLLTTWKKGRALLFARLAEDSMPVELFLESLSAKVTRVPGTAVFLSGTTSGVPHALLHNLKHNRVIHERVIFLTVVTDETPHVNAAARLEIQHLGRRFYRIKVNYGYLDSTDIPEALRDAARFGIEFNDMETSFFLGRETLIPSRRPGMALWRESLFAWMSRSATSALDFFKLPPNRVVELGTQVEI
jgi:KUP system potassium uptake protein